MIDTRYLHRLLTTLKAHGVKHVKMQDLELSFHVEQAVDALKNSEDFNDSTKIIADTLKKQEEAMPADLRADALMDQDKILNWSSPDQSEEELPLPLTGEESL